MSKRHAELPLEQDFSGSPASKKARVEDQSEGDSPNGAGLSSDKLEQDGRNGADIEGAAEIEREELEEAEKDPSGLSDIDEDAPALSAPKRQSAPMEGYGDLYLDTINREILDFDFEKLCSVSLSNINVYACLVCGKYFQGRGPKSHAYFHALEVGHHVFINIGTRKVYVLPEGYEVKNKSLDDIKYVVDPHYTKNEVVKLDREVHDAWDLSGARYRPGKRIKYTGNWILGTDYLSHRIRWHEQHQSQ
jgi:U4/U6.U5 tri-snRNP-associated protein 2